MAPGHATSAAIEKVIDQVGAFGRYQKLFMFFMQMLAICFALRALSVVFLVLEPVYHCHDNGTSGGLMTGIASMKEETCDVISNCTNYTISKPHGFHSIAFEWPHTMETSCAGLFNPLLLILSIREICAGSAYLLSGVLSDYVGRKPIVLCGVMSAVIFAFASSTAQSLLAYTPLYCILYTSGSLVFTPLYALLAECTLPRYRLSMTFSSTYTFAYFVVALVAYLGRDWRIMMIACGIVGIPFIAMLAFVIVESPRWLIVSGNYEKAAKSLNKIAWVNGRAVRFTADSLAESLQGLNWEPEQKNEVPRRWYQAVVSLRIIFTKRKLTIFLLYVTSFWLVAAAVANNFLSNAGRLSLSPYLSLTLVAIFRSWTPFVIMGLDIHYPKFNRRRFLMTSAVLVVLPMFVGTIFSIVAQYSEGMQMT